MESHLIENTFLNYSYLNIIFHDFITKSKNIFDDIKKKGIDNLDVKFREAYIKNLTEYENKLTVLTDKSINAKNTKKEAVKIFGLDITKENTEDSIFEEIKMKIIEPLKNVEDPKDSNVTTLFNYFSKYYYKYILLSFALYIFIIKVMKENESKKIGDISQEYLFEGKNLKRIFKYLKNSLKKYNQSLKKENKLLHKKMMKMKYNLKI